MSIKESEKVTSNAAGWVGVQSGEDKRELSPRDALWLMTNAHEISQAIHVAASLGIADLLKEKPRTVEDLARSAGVDAQALTRLMRVLTSVGVFAAKDGIVTLTPTSEYLRTDVPGSVRPWAIQVGRPYVWSTWAHLLYSVQTGKPAFPELYDGMTPWQYRASHPEEDAIFNEAMAGLSEAVTEAVVRSYDFSRIGVLADIGGGKGALIAAVLEANPNMRGILFDQPHVVADAGSTLEKVGVTDRCEVVGGDFFKSVPEADVYVMKHVIHDWDDTASVEILRTLRASMKESTKLLLVEQLVHSGRELDRSKLVDLQMLVILGGRERTADEFEALLKSSGFKLSSITPTGSPFNIIEGTPV